MSQSLIARLHTIFPQLVFESDVSLAPFTTVKIGGPAEVVWKATNRSALIEILKFCHQSHIACTILGWGANTLIADAGLRGLVIINQTRQITVMDSDTTTADQGFNDPATPTTSRWHTDSLSSTETLFDYYSGNESLVQVQLDSGTPLPYAINWLYEQGVTGLEWFSRIPATIGGAIYNNIHGANRFIGDAVASVDVVDEHAQLQTLLPKDLEFDYDYSRFHHTSEIITTVTLNLIRGPVSQARAAGIQWAQHKQHQPQKSLGCVFQNISGEDQSRLGLPTPSVGYIVDKKLHLAGFRIGDAQVSLSHAAFIENVGSASAQDYLSVISHIQLTAQKQLGLTLIPEIFFKGFTNQELDTITTQSKGTI